MSDKVLRFSTTASCGCDGDPELIFQKSNDLEHGYGIKDPGGH